MGFLSIFIRRPVFALMLNLSIVVVGMICYFRLGVDLNPNVDVPVVTVTVTLQGASPEVMESQVARVVEDAVATVSGMESVTSTSLSDTCTVVVMFTLGKDVNVATQEVRDKVASVRNDLPRDILEPVVAKYDPNGTPVIYAVLSGKQDPRVMSAMARSIKDTLQSLPGVGQVKTYGEQKRQVNIDLDYRKMQAFGVAVGDVKRAVEGQNQEYGGGSLRSSRFEVRLRTMGQLTSVDQFNRITLKNSENGVPVLLKDVGRAVDGMEDVSTIARLNNERALSLAVLKTSDANRVTVIDAVKVKVAELKASLPPGMGLTLSQDTSVFIRDSVHEIMQHLVLGSALAGLMVLMFLGDWRATLIAVVAIPTSVIGGFIPMQIFGYTLNQITMLALALVVGIVIDDAVVVLEEVARLMEEEHLSPVEAAARGVEEIGFSVLATTLSLVVIFVPIALLPGMIGRYFNCYGVIMAATIMVSMVVSFSLTPMLCSRYLKPPRPRDPTRKRIDLNELLLLRPYTWLLHFTLRFRFLIILLCVGVAWWGVHLYQTLGQDFVRAQDEGSLTINVRPPSGTSIEENDRLVRDIVAQVQKKIPHLGHTLATVQGQGDRSSIYIELKPWEERERQHPVYTVFDAVKTCRQILAGYPNARSSVGTSADTDMECVLVGPDLGVLTRASGQVVDALKKTPGFVDLDTDLDPGSPEARVFVDRERAAWLKVSVGDAASAVHALVGGVKAGSYFEGKDRFDVVVRLLPEQRQWASVVGDLSVAAADGKLIPMSNVTHLEWGPAATAIRHANRQRQVKVSCNLVGVPLGEAMDLGARLVTGMKLGPEYNVEWQGQGKYMAPTLLLFLVAFLVSVVFMYMVLASQFESLVDPVIILVTLPLSLPFALVSLQATGNTLNIFSTLGLFLLFGVVKKNAIFQIDTTNHMVRAGHSLYHAIVEANRIRLRPILMTTVTLVVAMAPVALAGANGWTRAPMAIVIVGGQTLSLLLTLLVVPALYSYAHDFWGRKYREERRQGFRSADAESSSASPPASEPPPMEAGQDVDAPKSAPSAGSGDPP